MRAYVCTCMCMYVYVCAYVCEHVYVYVYVSVQCLYTDSGFPVLVPITRILVCFALFGFPTTRGLYVASEL